MPSLYFPPTQVEAISYFLLIGKVSLTEVNGNEGDKERVLIDSLHIFFAELGTQLPEISRHLPQRAADIV